jgi:uncharacterized protein
VSYTPPFFLFNAHLETIYPAVVRRVKINPYQRERITTPDDDFLDLDWLTQNASKLVVISHGLEGNTERAYIKGMAKAFFNRGFDVLTWNYRGCSGEINRQLRFYHSGATDDLDTVINHAAHSGKYAAINLIGFSLGGNLTLKYLGEQRSRTPLLRKAVVFSVPMNLYTSCLKISARENWIYSQRFLKSLRRKVIEKARVRNDLDIKHISKIKTLLEFDDFFTGPIHGFKNAIDYYEQSSSIHFVQQIDIPTLIVNAKNDPFLSRACYPENELNCHSNVIFESPGRGGHVGFTQFHENGLYWSEQRALHFLNHD